MAIPWIEKYRPQSRNDLKGNTQQINSIMVFLQNWDREMKSKALILLGPPGCGKTSSVYALAKDNEFQVVEVNASDVRNKKSLKRNLSIISRSHDFDNPRPRIILIDEVDGLAGNSDRGGLKELTTIIKNSIHPVICTANDPESDKIKSLARVARIIEFKRLEDEDLFSLVETIANKEDMIIDDDEIDSIVINSQGDLRSAINDLESFSKGNKELLERRNKMMSMLDILNTFFSSKSKKDARDSLSQAPSNYPYLIAFIFDQIYNQCASPKEIFGCYEQVALADMHMKRIIFTQNWKLLKYVFDHLSVGTFLHRKERHFSMIDKLAPYPNSSKYIGIARRKQMKLSEMAPKFSKRFHISRSDFIYRDHEIIFKILNGVKGSDIAAGIGLDDDEIAYIAKKSTKSSLKEGIPSSRDRLQTILFEKSVKQRKLKEESLDDELNQNQNETREYTIDDFF